MIKVYFSELPKTLTEILELKYDETMSYEETASEWCNEKTASKINLGRS